MDPSRRHFLHQVLRTGVAVGAALVVAPWVQAGEKIMNWLTVTDEEWKTRLTPAQYHVLRAHGTERPHTSPLNAEKRAGVYHCAGCALPLFSSATKYESGTGWPSFYEPLKDAVGTQEDKSWWATRTEVHCARCKGHLGHVFPDGPPPTGLRYCMNGVALSFVPTP